MATPRPLLARLLKTPDLAKIVPHLEPQLVHRVIDLYGLEDCAELIALATPQQISRVLDLDLWRGAPGADEQLDADRFGVWLEVLVESGAAVAAEKVMGLDIELVTTGLARHVAVYAAAAVSTYTMLDGTVVPARELRGDLGREIGGCLITSRRTTAWDAIVELLAFLDGEHPVYFRRLMRGCMRLSNGTREADGFHHLLEDAEQDLFDLEVAREARRDTQGYVAPPQARAFLQDGRALRLDGDPPPRNPIARAYFHTVESAQSAGLESKTRPTDSPASDVDADAVAEVVGVLREAGVFTPPPRGLLESGSPEVGRLALIHAHVETHAAGAEELAFLANTLIAGCSLQARAFTPQEASDAAAAICNLGLENWPTRWPDRDLLTAFQVGWTVLHRDVCLLTAKRLIAVIGDLHCADRDIHLRLNGLRKELKQHLRDRAPWRAREALDVIVMLDALSWAALSALIDECPVLHAAVGASQQHRRTIDPADFVFIARNDEIAAVREFLESLPSRLIA